MAGLARFCHFWRMTPAEYEALEPGERDALTEYANRYIQDENRAARKASKRG